MKLFLNPFAECPKDWKHTKTAAAAMLHIAGGSVTKINFVAELGYGPGLYFSFLEGERDALRDGTRSTIGHLRDYQVGAEEELKDFAGGSGDSVAFWIYLGARHGLPRIDCSFYETPTPTMSAYIRLTEKEWGKR